MFLPIMPKGPSVPLKGKLKTSSEDELDLAAVSSMILTGHDY